MPLRPRWTSIVVTWPQRAFSAKKISDESEITEEWKEVSGRRTTSRSCYYRDSGLVQLPIMSTRRPRGGGFKALIFGQARKISRRRRCQGRLRARSAWSDAQNGSIGNARPETAGASGGGRVGSPRHWRIFVVSGG